jgi:hypothetical protein
MSNVAYGKRGAKKAQIEAIREGGAHYKLVPITTGKPQPAHCLGKPCASIDPLPKAKLCKPCDAAMTENAKRDLSFTNYKSNNDWR